MIFRPTAIEGLIGVLLQRHTDERGSFARSFCTRTFAEAGLEARFVQASASVTRIAGTLRGMHWQRAPSAETKLVRCVRGAVHDVVADIRPHSASFMRVEAFRLEAHGDLSLYIPPGCAHGFQTLVDDTEILYQMSVEYVPEQACGFRFDDQAFAIAWPLTPSVVAEKDLAWPAFRRPRADLA